nr:reverse transcriptase domain-containing protein [Tanacetum cinerariifolium]
MAFKSEQPRTSKPRFASQVDVNNDLSKPVTTHYLPKERESNVVKPHHVIASSKSRNSSKNMQRFSSNDMVYNHYLDEARKKTQEKACQKCVFNANHDFCVTKFLKEVNSRVKVSSNKTTNRDKPVEQTSVAKKPKRQIPKVHRFSIKQTSVVHEKPMTPRSCLRWKPTGKIFKSVGLRWVLTRKIFTSSTTKVDSEPTNGSNDEITNQYECEQTLDVSAESDSLPHAHAQTTKTYYKHQDSRIKKAQELKTKTFAKSDIKDNSLETKLWGRLLESFQEDAKYEHEFKDHTLGEIVSLKYVYEHESSESAGSLTSREIVSLKYVYEHESSESAGSLTSREITPLPPYIDARIEAWLVAPTPTLPPPSLLSPLSSPLPRITSPILPSSPIHIDFILEDHMLIYKRAQFSTMSHRFEIRESFTTAARQLRSVIKELETELWNLTVKGTDVESYTQCFQELVLLCSRMVLNEFDKVKRYVGGLLDSIHGSVMASKIKILQEAIELVMR